MKLKKIIFLGASFKPGSDDIRNSKSIEFIERFISKSNLKFEFGVDKKKNSIFITRELNAKLDLVWDAWTKREIMDQWWAPKPFESRTKVMDFVVGGRRFYAMVSADGQELNYSIQTLCIISSHTFCIFRALHPLRALLLRLVRHLQ